MTAKEMFEKCGYQCYADNEKHICYTKTEIKWGEEPHKRVKFKLNQKKLTIHSDVSMELLNAINKHCEELGWGKTDDI